MRAKLGSRFILVLVAGLLASESESRADFASCTNPLSACTATTSSCCVGTFGVSGTNNPLIITMDRCHQPLGTGTLGPPGAGAPRKEWVISSISRAGSTVTVTTSANHGIGTGETVRVVGTGNSALNGSFTVTSGCAACTTLQYSTTTSGNIAASAPPNGRVLSFNTGNGWCVEAPGTDATRIGGSTADSGMLRGYGLVYRLMQRGIPVYWLVNPSKSPVALTASQNASSQTYLASDVDFWVLTSDLTDPPTSAAGLAACGVGCTQPVHRLKIADLSKYTDSYRYKEFPVRGGAFLIAAENRAAFNDFWLHTGAYASLAGQTKYDWSTSGIDMYELDSTAKVVYQDFTVGDGTSVVKWQTNTGAPVAVKVDYEPARVACLGCNSNVAQAWLGTAGLNDPATASSCPSGEFSPSDATYCLLNDYDVAQGTLVSGGFSWLWMFGYNDNSPCGNSSEKAVFDKARDFMTSIPAVRNAGHGIFLDDSIKVAEGCPGKQLMGFQQTTSDGLDIQSSGNAEPFIIRYPANVFMQFGDLAPAIASGTVKGWKYYKSGTPTIGYQSLFQVVGSSLKRLMSVDTTGTNNTLCLRHDTTTVAGCDSFTPTASTGDIFDLAAYARLNDNLNNGLVYYLPGNQLNNSGNYAELRMLLNSLIALPDESFTTTPVETEVARSSPIVATIENQSTVVSGTYVRMDPIPSIPKATTSSGLVRFTFPYLKGHLRAIPTSSYAACSGAGCSTSNATRTKIDSLTGALFDAANGIPTATAAGCSTNFNGSCRSVFTTTVAGRLPSTVMFNTANVSTLGPLIGSNLTTTEQQTLISRILAGVPDGLGGYVSKLGGVDRSTPAVIGVSPLAGSTSRPTMIYFGATDGMLHAVCASTGGGCDQVGRELWAYIPRTELNDLRNSVARVDGSPHVIDAYGDFDNTGVNSWRTILIFHTGTGTMTKTTVVPAVYALDITTPNNPKVLWEYSVTDVAPYDVTLHPNGRGAYEMGIGLNIVAGSVTIGGANKTVAFVQSNNGGTGGAASVLTALNVESGAEIWQVGDLYPTNSGNSARTASHEAAPSSGIPGGAVGVDMTGANKITHVVYGDLYGDVFVRSADTGANQQTGSSPLLRISTDYHPIGVSPAILKIGSTTYAAFTTGGYADSQGTLWRGTNEATVPTQFAFAVNIGYTGATITETNATNVPIKFDFGSSSEGGFAQIIVVGGEMFVVTDNTNVNSYDYGSYSSPTGKVYRYNFGIATPVQESTLVVAGGAGSLFNDGTTLLSSSGAYGERLTADAISTTGTAVDPISTATTILTRKLWLRSE
ncbi:MAG TPA: hypothetical protein VLB44_13570 [Kofleriaceae bacterium]|nr:hypothetical protein [Kofleriaceae bacterium]